MAVQAQYPSNILFLNRNSQDGHDYSLQAQPGGYLDQSHMLFNNGGGAVNNTTNQRKRGRETSAATEISPSILPFSLQQQSQPPPPQLIDLSQLHSHNHNHNNPNVVSTGLRLSFGDQQQQQQQQQQQFQQHHNQQQQQHSSALFSVLTEDFATQIKHQRDELDQFLQAQGEQLQRTLAEKRQRHYRALLNAAEESIARRLREKDVEVEKATRRNAELEARAAQLSVEAQVWQAKARAQQATAATLQAQLQQAMMSGGFVAAQDSRRGDDGVASSAGVEGQAEDAESAYIDPERVTMSAPSCKACRKRVASVVILPCRHLCLCTECDQMVQACPLCLCMRNSSVEVFLS
ncbi:PREDICTED: BOI-related E3 ubiquitin- [Prunus dulcis]|uniref:PREDICTED: BOI-related E3 ubiquitin n=1 Tax=Prunus dulcis TaxID=3755 RepID=A0A5E4FPY9_PRUDU|nr:E3 ubiquitin-protein ligase BOI isoform X1 [Prunus dulcis]VVA29460.1 PREDICTED: BOI-related E3 ubiquitin- [Prunus dulcis]